MKKHKKLTEIKCNKPQCESACCRTTEWRSLFENDRSPETL